MGLDDHEKILKNKDNLKRAENVLKNADKINCKKFVTSRVRLMFPITQNFDVNSTFFKRYGR